MILCQLLGPCTKGKTAARLKPVHLLLALDYNRGSASVAQTTKGKHFCPLQKVVSVKYGKQLHRKLANLSTQATFWKETKGRVEERVYV